LLASHSGAISFGHAEAASVTDVTLFNSLCLFGINYLAVL